MMAEKLIRVGIIGAGGNSRSRHIPGFQAIKGVEVTGLVNRTRVSGETAAKEFGIPQVFDDWQSLVADPDIDAVCIGTWPNLHCEATVAALHAGKPHIVVPHIGDQDFFSAEVKRLGCGIRARKKTWPEKLIDKVERVESDPSFGAAAQRALDALQDEDGPAEAVAQIECFLEHRRHRIGESLDPDEDF
jgi:predicted homoserine dehydrogenase-like protein